MAGYTFARLSSKIGVALGLLLTGCHGAGANGLFTNNTSGGLLTNARLWKENPPTLLIGPEAAAQAPPPPELPPAEVARLALRTAQEFEKNGRIPEAIQFYEKARAHDPGLRLVAGRRLAVLYDLSGQFAQADAQYGELLRAFPKDADLLNDIGYSHYCRGQWSTAEQHLLRAVQLQPQHKKAWVNLGMARAQQGRIEESLQAFQQAVSPAEAHCNVAFVLAAQGKHTEALRHYQQALQLNPGLTLAQAALSRLSSAPGEKLSFPPTGPTEPNQQPLTPESPGVFPHLPSSPSDPDVPKPRQL
ncbi:MAG: tetratricopeptide repeat protein [Thermogemmata sp.]|nr:tetratricopeptide repeat protein [Thermogemmata sp.]